MTLSLHQGFTAGIVEGFYGPPWSENERLELLGWMRKWGLNAYLYAPKDDLKHRVQWRERYSAQEIEVFRRLLQAYQRSGVTFVYGISPGLSIRHCAEGDLQLLVEKLHQLLQLGCKQVALLFDDIPDQLDSEDRTRWDSAAAAQAFTANKLLERLRELEPCIRLWFCPTPYCERMARRGVGGCGYLEILGRELRPEIPVVWTGPEIISECITVDSVERLNKVLGRKVALWDNLLANDYDGRRFFCGPYAGRAPELRQSAEGIFLNPNTEFPLNYPGLRSFASWVGSSDNWDARQSYLDAVREWFQRFPTAGEQISFEELIALLDCYYLPHHEGEECRKLYESYAKLLAMDPATWGSRAPEVREKAQRLQRTCANLARLIDRPLFHALSRRIWDLREELDLAIKILDAGMAGAGRAVCYSDFHLPGTYAGGITAKLQRLIRQQSDGAFVPSGGPPETKPL